MVVKVNASSLCRNNNDHDSNNAYSYMCNGGNHFQSFTLWLLYDG